MKPFAMERGNPLKATPTCLGEGDSLERSRLLSLYHCSRLKNDCNEQDRWRRRLNDDDLEGKDQARVTGKVLGGMTSLDVDDREHQMEEQPLEKR